MKQKIMVVVGCLLLSIAAKGQDDWSYRPLPKDYYWE